MVFNATFNNIAAIALGLWGFNATFKTIYFSYISAVSLIGGGNRRKPPTCRTSLTNFITQCCIEHTSP